MSSPAEKPEVVQLPAEAPVAQPVNTRRVAAQRVREARDRLTSSSGTRPAFDTELLRQDAQTRVSASFVVMLLVVSTTADTSSPAFLAKCRPSDRPWTRPAMQIWLTILVSWPLPAGPSRLHLRA